MADVTAPMAGSIYLVHVTPGDMVEAEAELITIESMKMEIPVSAPSAGTVREVRVQPGDLVQEDDVLVVLE